MKLAADRQPDFVVEQDERLEDVVMVLSMLVAAARSCIEQHVAG